MTERQQLKTTLSSFNDSVEDVACGWVNHRFKGYRTKRRWGQLRVSMDANQGHCAIQLFKDVELSPTSFESHKRPKKEPKKKFELNFTRAEFCGIEKGEHHDRYGTRRYLCIITKQSHLIIEDAVMTSTGLNHNILGTWYQRISEVMKYVNRWKIIEKDPKLASSKVCYLHVSSENTSECHSLEDKTRDNRDKLVLRSWRTKDLTDVKEHLTTMDDQSTTDVIFQVQELSGGSSLVRMSVEGALELRKIVEQARRSSAANRKATTTICPGFNDLNCSPNLIKLPPTKKKLSKILPGSSNSPSGSGGKAQHTDKKTSQVGPNNHQGNLYVRLEPEPVRDQMQPDANTSNTPYQNLLNGHAAGLCIESDRDTAPRCPSDRPGPSNPGPPGHCSHNSNKVVVPPSLAGHSPTRSLTPEFIPPFVANGGWNPSPSPPHFPSSPVDDDGSNSIKKAPRLNTQTSFDSDYHTGDFTFLSEATASNDHYVNLSLRRGNSDPDVTRRPHPPSGGGSVYQNLNTGERPPEVPDRDHRVDHRGSNGASLALQHQQQQQSYVNLAHRNSFPCVDRALAPPPLVTRGTPPIPPKDFRSKSSEGNGSQTSPPIYRNPPRPPPPRNPPVEHSFNMDPLWNAINRQELPPLSGDEQPNISYENSYHFETSINEVLHQTHWSETRDRWLDLTYSVFLSIALGLEKADVGTAGDWKAFAEELGLTFQNIQQLHGLMHSHPTLRPFEVVLLHWCRMDAPIPFNRANLRLILVKIQRSDLADLVPLDGGRRTSNGSR